MKLSSKASIDLLELSIHTYLGLRNADRYTIGELAQCSREELRRVPIGLRTREIREIEEEMARKGWSLAKKQNGKEKVRWSPKLDAHDWHIILRAHWSFRKRTLLEALRNEHNRALTLTTIRALPRLANFELGHAHRGPHPLNLNFQKRNVPYRLLSNPSRSTIRIYKRITTSPSKALDL